MGGWGGGVESGVCGWGLEKWAFAGRMLRGVGGPHG